MGISVKVEGNHAIIDDGNIRIDKTPLGNYNVKALDYHTVTTSNRSPEPKKAPEPYFDPHVYTSFSSNGLTVAESVERAMGRIGEMLANYGVSFGNRDKVKEVVRRMIVASKGRDKVYSLAGRIAKDINKEVYKGVPFHILFDALESGEMSFPEHVSKNPCGEVPLESSKFTNTRYSDIIRNTPPYTGYKPFGRYV